MRRVATGCRHVFMSTMHMGTCRTASKGIAPSFPPESTPLLQMESPRTLLTKGERQSRSHTDEGYELEPSSEDALEPSIGKNAVGEIKSGRIDILISVPGFSHPTHQRSTTEIKPEQHQHDDVNGAGWVGLHDKGARRRAPCHSIAQHRRRRRAHGGYNEAQLFTEPGRQGVLHLRCRHKSLGPELLEDMERQANHRSTNYPDGKCDDQGHNAREEHRRDNDESQTPLPARGPSPGSPSGRRIHRLSFMATKRKGS